MDTVYSDVTARDSVWVSQMPNRLKEQTAENYFKYKKSNQGIWL